ncbi:MAG: HAD hydrolase family protein [Nocardioides sp.]
MIVAIDGRDAPAAVEALVALGLDHQVVHNRAAAMILPAGVTKGAALVAALHELGLSPHNAVAVGDAENDLSLLRSAEVGAAVANAVRRWRRTPTSSLPAPNGAGVVGLLEGPLLSGHQRFCPPRRRISIGWYDDGGPVTLPASQGACSSPGTPGRARATWPGSWPSAGSMPVMRCWSSTRRAITAVSPVGPASTSSTRRRTCRSRTT